jgi:hypothetical protein
MVSVAKHVITLWPTQRLPRGHTLWGYTRSCFIYICVITAINNCDCLCHLSQSRYHWVYFNTLSALLARSEKKREIKWVVDIGKMMSVARWIKQKCPSSCSRIAPMLDHAWSALVAARAAAGQRTRATTPGPPCRARLTAAGRAPRPGPRPRAARGPRPRRAVGPAPLCPHVVAGQPLPRRQPPLLAGPPRRFEPPRGRMGGRVPPRAHAGQQRPDRAAGAAPVPTGRGCAPAKPSSASGRCAKCPRPRAARTCTPGQPLPTPPSRLATAACEEEAG